MNQPDSDVLFPLKMFQMWGFFQLFPSTFQTLQLNLTILKYFCRHNYVGLSDSQNLQGPL